MKFGQLRIGARHEVQAQSELFLVIRNLTIVEGIVLRYAPELDPAVEVKEITGNILRRRVMGPQMRAEMTQLIPQLLLTIFKRPQLVDRLMRLERSFTDSKSLGEFLRREKVLAEREVPRGSNAMLVAAGVGLAVAVGWLLRELLGM